MVYNLSNHKTHNVCILLHLTPTTQHKENTMTEADP